MWIAFSAQAVDYYLIGGFNSWSLAQTSCKFTDQGDGTYVLDYNGTLTSGFKINDGTWSNDNANFGGSATLTLGVTYNLTVGGSSGNIPLSGNIEKPHIVFNPTARTLLITGQEKEAAFIYGIHGDIFGNTNWSTENMTESDGKWVLADKTINAGSFGIKEMDKDTGSQTSWISADGTATVTVGETLKCKVEGTNFSIAAGTYTFTFDPKAMTLVVTGTSTGETPEVDPFANYWVNLGGEFNGNNFYDGGVQPVNKIATFTNQAIGQKGFKVKTWDGSTDQYYIADGESSIPTDQWVQFAIDGYDTQVYIKDAPANGVYDVEYNVETNQIYLKLVSGGEVTPPTPATLYIIGDNVDGQSWALETNPMTYNEETGVYTWTGKTLGSGFKFNDGSWSGLYNIGSMQDESVMLKLGEPYAVENNSDSHDILFADGSLVDNPVVTLDLEKKTVTVTGEYNMEPIIPDVFYVRGSFNEWEDGIAMTKQADMTEDGKYVYVLNQNITGTFKITEEQTLWSGLDFGANEGATFSESGKTEQAWNGSTNDFTIDGTHQNMVITFYYDAQSSIDKNTPSYVKVDWNDETPEQPFHTLFIIGDVNDGTWAANNGVAMVDEGDEIFTIESVQIGSKEGDAYFSFAVSLGADENDWNGMGKRFAAISNNYTFENLESGEEIEAEDVLQGENPDNSFMVPAGKYYLYVSLEDKTVVIQQLEVLKDENPEPGEEISVYVVGNGPEMTWDLPGQEYTGENKVVTFELKGVSKFKVSTVKAEANDWDTFNAGAYATGETLFGDAVANAGGQTLPIVKWGEDQKLPWTGDYTITLDLDKMTMTAYTATPKPLEAPNVYILGAMNDWKAQDSYKLENTSWDASTQTGTWTWEGAISEGQEFKFADESWGVVNYGGVTGIKVNELVNLQENGENLTLAQSFDGTLTFTITESNSKATVIFEMEGPAPEPEQFYVIGTLAEGGWNPTIGVEMKSIGEGLYVADEVTLVESGGSTGFAIVNQLGTNVSDWSTVNAMRYGPKDNNAFAVVGENTDLAMGDRSWKFNPGTYKMTFDYKNTTLLIEELSVTVPDLYLLGTMNEWTPSDEWMFTTEDEIIYTLENVTIPANSEFKVAPQSWANNYTFSYTDDVINPNTTYTLSNLEGDNTNMKSYDEAMNNATVTFNFETKEFEIKVVVEEPTADAYLGISENGVPTEPNEEMALTKNEDGTYSGEFTIPAGSNFNIWLKKTVATRSINADLYDAYGPAQPTEFEYTSKYQTLPGSFTQNAEGYWTLANDVDCTISFTVDFQNSTIEAENQTYIPVPEAAGQLVLEDFEMIYTEGSDEVRTAEVPVNLELETGMGAPTYMGFQFDVTLPANVSVTGVQLGEGLDGTVAFAKYEKNTPNTYRVVTDLSTNDGVGYSVVENLVTLTISANNADLERASYPYDETVTTSYVRFSTILGDDMEEFVGGESTMTIVDKTVHTESVEIKSVTLAAPSYDTKQDTPFVTAATMGEDLDVVIEVIPTDSTDELVWSVTIDGVESQLVTIEGEDENWTVDTSNLGLNEGESVEMVVTATSGDQSDSFTVTVWGIMLGDSNFSHMVTVADVVTTANFIASPAITSTRFDWPNANVVDNDAPEAVDGISIEDVTATVEIVLGTWEGRGVRRHTRSMLTNDNLVADNFKVTDGVFSVGINLNDTYAYAGLQAVVEIPEGMTVKNVTAGPRAANHQLVYHVTEDGNVNVVIFSYSNAQFSDVEGSLFNLEVVANEDCGNIRIDNIRAADAASNGYSLSYAGGENVSGTTGIDGIDAENGDVRYFTVDGVEIVNPEAGQIVIRVEGNKATKVIM